MPTTDQITAAAHRIMRLAEMAQRFDDARFASEIAKAEDVLRAAGFTQADIYWIVMVAAMTHMGAAS